MLKPFHRPRLWWGLWLLAVGLPFGLTVMFKGILNAF